MNAPLLVPIDLSDSSRSVLARAVDIARSEQRPLAVLHVVHGSAADDGIYRETDSQHPSRPLIEVAEYRLRDFILESRGQIPGLAAIDEVRPLVVAGVPANRILEVAEREGAAEIVMGSHGRNGVARLIKGSVAETVTRKSSVPVTVVKSVKAAPEQSSAA